MIEALGNYPTVTAMDIMDKADDDALRRVCREKGNVVTGSYINYSTAFVQNENGDPYIDYFHMDSVSQPITENDCCTGFVNAATDEDGILRSAFMTRSSPEVNEGEVYRSFSSVIYSLLFMLVGYLVNLVRKYVHDALEKKRVTDALRKYAAPQVVDEIAAKGNYTIKPGGENRHIAVLFVDIRGFTPMSESPEPEQVVDILNSYLNLTTNAIFKNGGTLDKFIGDAIMAVFNAAFDPDDYVFRAVRIAPDIVNGGNEIESKFLEKYGKSVSFDVGVNCGNAVVGNIGCDFRMDYTAIGDTVNMTARLEANAKAFLCIL